MIRLFKHRLPQDFFKGSVDVHCHLLPGVDDGFPMASSSIEALKVLEKKGVSKIVLTPHFMKEYPKNDRKHISKVFGHFKSEAEEAGIAIELRLAGEYMLDRCFLEHFEDGFLTLDKEGIHVLCETSYMMYERNVTGMLYDIMCAGLQPVIAHPERYDYASRKDYERWKDKDYKFQLNLMSLVGAYGEVAFEKAHHMLNDGMYDFVGSDMHNLDSFKKWVPRMKLPTKSIEKLARLIENNKELVG